MRRRLLELLGVATAIATVAVLLQVTPVSGQGQEPATTAWGHPDLEGIWLDVYSTPLQRAPGIGEREFATEEERAARDQAALARPPILPSGAYNTVYTSARPAVGPAPVAPRVDHAGLVARGPLLGGEKLAVAELGGPLEGRRVHVEPDALQVRMPPRGLTRTLPAGGGLQQHHDGRDGRCHAERLDQSSPHLRTS